MFSPLKNVSLRFKVIAVTGIGVLLACIAAIIATFTFVVASEQFTRISNAQLPEVSSILALTREFADVEVQTRGLLGELSKRPLEVDGLRERSALLGRYVAGFEQTLENSIYFAKSTHSAYEKNEAGHEEEEAEIYETIENEWSTYKAEIEKLQSFAQNTLLHAAGTENKASSELTELLEEADGLSDANTYEDNVLKELEEALDESGTAIRETLFELEDDEFGEITKTVDELRAGTFTQTIYILAFLLATILFVGGVGIPVTISVFRSIKQVTIVAEAVSSGDLRARAEVNGTNEIATLGRAFNIMLDKVDMVQQQISEEVKEKTVELQSVVTKLEKSKAATLNLLEDLSQEKASVEKEVEQRTTELQEERKKLSTVTSSMEDGAILLDFHGQVLFCNQAIKNMLGLKKVVNESLLETFFKVFGDGELRRKVLMCVSEGVSGEARKLDAEGRIYNVMFQRVSHDEGKGQSLIDTLIFVRDITDETILERSKSELVAVASHQLRTPLTAMRGNVEMLVDGSYGEMSKEQKELLDDIDISTVRLISMVNDMLDITKIEKGDLDLRIEQFEVEGVVDSIVKDLKEYAKRHDFTIYHKKAKNVIPIFGDVVRVRQVLQNLIDNAVKYSRHPGTLDITYAVKKDMLEVSLKDNGIGIPKVEQKNMFNRFYRASNTAKTTSSGSGLGLYIVKSIVEQLGGSISFESKENVGTTFYVRLPIKEIIHNKEDHGKD